MGHQARFSTPELRASFTLVRAGSVQRAPHNGSRAGGCGRPPQHQNSLAADVLDLGGAGPGRGPVRRPDGATAPVLDRSLVATCKDAIGWMFSKLDTNADLYLDQAELAAINLDKYEVCIRPFFNSCDSYKDGKVSTAEWCLCFWREKPPCLAELERMQVQEPAKKRLGVYIPSCDEDGYYRKLQCDQARGECWCVDQHGGELMGSRIHGNPDCDEVAGYSGDFGSGVGWDDEEEKEAEETGEEAEEEEEEEERAEADDGGYIW
ncbi:hypothetical protein ACEWY4_026262 [Coilia grayii]|uniref:Thyroglobulin type-1 domain-containing protein n=1 Tax=Coilia grayii TaxID=363190 RepID=A0ABD1IUB9_9TELE